MPQRESAPYVEVEDLWDSIHLGELHRRAEDDGGEAEGHWRYVETMQQQLADLPVDTVPATRQVPPGVGETGAQWNTGHSGIFQFTD